MLFLAIVKIGILYFLKQQLRFYYQKSENEEEKSLKIMFESHTKSLLRNPSARKIQNMQTQTNTSFNKVILITKNTH